MKVLFVSPEVNPLVRTGGLGDVVGSLPISLKKLGVDVRVICPLHRECKNIESRVLGKQLSVKLKNKAVNGYIREAKLGNTDIPAYLIDLPELFDRAGIYSDENGDFPDNAQRAFALCQAALQLEDISGWQPQVVHAHDWMAAPVCGYLNAMQIDKPDASKIRSVLTIHNLQHQGVFSYGDFLVQAYLIQVGAWTGSKKMAPSTCSRAASKMQIKSPPLAQLMPERSGHPIMDAVWKRA